MNYILKYNCFNLTYNEGQDKIRAETKVVLLLGKSPPGNFA